jgi:predicted DNA-binding transcriptional regulator AlpA
MKPELHVFINIARVKEISGFSKSTILRRIDAGTFPRPVIADGNCRRWDLAEVLAWRAAQFEKRAQRQQHKATPRAATG